MFFVPVFEPQAIVFSQLNALWQTHPDNAFVQILNEIKYILKIN